MHIQAGQCGNQIGAKVIRHSFVMIKVKTNSDFESPGRHFVTGEIGYGQRMTSLFALSAFNNLIPFSYCLFKLRFLKKYEWVWSFEVETLVAIVTTRPVSNFLCFRI